MTHYAPRVASILLLIAATASAQPPLYTDALPPEEFAARRMAEGPEDAILLVEPPNHVIRL